MILSATKIISQTLSSVVLRLNLHCVIMQTYKNSSHTFTSLVIPAWIEISRNKEEKRTQWSWNRISFCSRVDKEEKRMHENKMLGAKNLCQFPFISTRSQTPHPSYVRNFNTLSNTFTFIVHASSFGNFFTCFADTNGNLWDYFLSNIRNYYYIFRSLSK